MILLGLIPFARSKMQRNYRTRVNFGFGTNNEAEFDSLKMALDETVSSLRAKSFDLVTASLIIEIDSTIVRNRLMVKDKVFKKYPRSAVMFELADSCLEVMRQFGHYNVIWKGRESNVERFGH